MHGWTMPGRPACMEPIPWAPEVILGSREQRRASERMTKREQRKPNKQLRNEKRKKKSR